MNERPNPSPFFLSTNELLNFSIFPREAKHFLNVDFSDHEAVELAFRSADISSQQRLKMMQDIYDAGHIQNWPLASQKTKQSFDKLT